MRLVVAAVGRLKDAERELCERYSKRFDAAGRSLCLGPLTITELSESRAAGADARKADEAARLMKAAGTADVRVVLDEGGKALSSEAFAKWIAQRRDGGAKGLAFLIGGPDGHGPAALDGAALKLSLGPMTLPHGMARAVLIEQLYRAATILSGHPYHRA
ncbi:23S rRNA (pseudouridine(1915)-N(3))-methyltransferase RlmH [Hyphomicrobium sp. xq]|uniref:Ribosomal RNA large subunit methyltransferase H n=1 Tax=Hyphomicrobium album TaxID=2665159 RepID=A0A6I3KLJ9_9HYPH|nr:23S rRNA (pseudouridine(1915)-N(3))-methyltransferase RlmH [Hyphomicrobium album]MTD95243.1 23S rRNA (pseudouridine(1915)-N(3))-methyltransferase RlmH [Hyphomicrobium album]